MNTISGTQKDNIGQYIIGRWCKNADSPEPSNFTAIGWTKDGKLVAQAVFLDYTGSNIEIHVQAKGCMTKQSIREVYTYVFKQLKCNRLTAKPKPSNKRLLQLLSRLGFEYEATLKNYYGEPDSPEDALVYKLTKLNAIKFLEKLDARRTQITTNTRSQSEHRHSVWVR